MQASFLFNALGWVESDRLELARVALQERTCPKSTDSE
jgi:hypothetical protein